jgi:hypothetical protein
MMPLSKLNLISDRMQEMTTAPRGLFASIFRAGPQKVAKVDLSIRIPHYDLLRAEMFTEDIMELCDYELKLNVYELVALLFKDFLSQVTNGTDHRLLLTKLMEKHDAYIRPTEIRKEYIQVTSNHLKFKEVVVPKKIKWVVLKLELTRKAALRGEVFLMDLSQIEPRFQITLEELIPILIMDFVIQLKAGNDGKLIQGIIDNLRDD